MYKQFSLTSDEEILERVQLARPMEGGIITQDITERIGCTHYDGWYHLTDKPYLLEGLEVMHQLGYRVAKIWFSAQGLPGYTYNSTWPSFTRETTLVDVAQMPYYEQAFAMDFRTFVLEVFTAQGNSWIHGPEGNDAYYTREEEEFYRLTKHLLETYRNRHLTFILQNWEGDWMLRGIGESWNPVPEDALRRCEGMVRWYRARQRGVDRARAEVVTTKCQVLYAAEVNKVYDALLGIPTVMTHVIPHVDLDLVSYSCYDALGDLPVSLWHAIEMIRQCARPSSTYGTNQVYIGEVGCPESEKERQTIESFWDQVMGVCLALDIPYVLQWELFCNEPKHLDRYTLPPETILAAEDLRGWWLIRPDGSPSFAQEYLMKCSESAGGVIRDK
ncbi:MAG: hypothetical protein M0Q40_00830 [Limnochordia bacterium]|jgi:hypothetical protein|nr:hypothetical protein [Limnochordia bacterium]